MLKLIFGAFLALTAQISVALESPSAWIETKTDMILAEISAADLAVDDRAGQAELAERVIIPNVNVEGIAMRAVGRPWRNVSETDRARFIAGMKNRMLDLYGGAFSQFKAAELEILNERISKRGDRAIVNTRLRRPGDDWLATEFRLVVIDDQWQLLDVAIEGVSLLSSYKAQMDERVERLGLAGAIEEVAAGK